MIYVAKIVGCDDRVKIGTSKNITDRLRQLSYQFGATMELVASREGDERTEGHIHSLLAADRVEGEWFKLTPAVSAICERLSEIIIPDWVASRSREVRIRLEHRAYSALKKRAAANKRTIQAQAAYELEPGSDTSLSNALREMKE